MNRIVLTTLVVAVEVNILYTQYICDKYPCLISYFGIFFINLFLFKITQLEMGQLVVSFWQIILIIN